MIYFITDGSDAIKIGSTDDVLARLKQLQCGNPRELKILFTCNGGVTEEHILHELFKEYRIKVNTSASIEWFKCVEKLKDFVNLDDDKKARYLNNYFYCQTVYSHETNEESIAQLKSEVERQQRYIHRLRSQLENLKNENKELKNSLSKIVTFKSKKS